MVSKEEIQKIARLSKLSLSADELESLHRDLAEIVAFADAIQSAVSEAEEFDNIGGLENAFREDVVQDSVSRADVLSNRNGGVNGFFLIRGKEEPAHE